MDILMMLVLMALMIGVAYLMAIVTITYACYQSTSAENFIRMIIQDVLVSSVVAVGAYFLLSLGHLVIQVLLLRLVFLHLSDWSLLLDNYDHIKSRLNVD